MSTQKEKDNGDKHENIRNIKSKRMMSKIIYVDLGEGVENDYNSGTYSKDYDGIDENSLVAVYKLDYFARLKITLVKEM